MGATIRPRGGLRATRRARAPATYRGYDPSRASLLQRPRARPASRDDRARRHARPGGGADLDRDAGSRPAALDRVAAGGGAAGVHRAGSSDRRAAGPVRRGRGDRAGGRFGRGRGQPEADAGRGFRRRGGAALSGGSAAHRRAAPAAHRGRRPARRLRGRDGRGRHAGRRCRADHPTGLPGHRRPVAGDGCDHHVRRRHHAPIHATHREQTAALRRGHPPADPAAQRGPFAARRDAGSGRHLGAPARGVAGGGAGTPRGRAVGQRRRPARGARPDRRRTRRLGGHAGLRLGHRGRLGHPAADDREPVAGPVTRRRRHVVAGRTAGRGRTHDRPGGPEADVTGRTRRARSPG